MLFLAFVGLLTVAALVGTLAAYLVINCLIRIERRAALDALQHRIRRGHVRRMRPLSRVAPRRRSHVLTHHHTGENDEERQPTLRGRILGQTCKSRAIDLRAIVRRLEAIEKYVRPGSYSHLEIESARRELAKIIGNMDTAAAEYLNWPEPESAMTTTDTVQSARDELTRLLAAGGWSYTRLFCKFGWRVTSWNRNRNPLPPAIDTLNEGDLRQFAYLLRTNVLDWMK